MKKSSEPQPPAEEAHLYDLELPVDPGFVTLPRRISLDQAILLNEQIRKWFPRSVPTQEQRWESKVQVEFIL